MVTIERTYAIPGSGLFVEAPLETLSPGEADELEKLVQEGVPRFALVLFLLGDEIARAPCWLPRLPRVAGDRVTTDEPSRFLGPLAQATHWLVLDRGRPVNVNGPREFLFARLLPGDRMSIEVTFHA